jgi:hypothetical protein
MVLEEFPTYRLTVEALKKFLNETFGTQDRSIEVDFPVITKDLC